MGRLESDLAAAGVERVETPISWVFLRGDEVFKVNKPVSLGFLGLSAAAKRRRACEAQVRLNRRLAPEVYLGCGPPRDRKQRHRVAGDGPAVDWAVPRRRLPEDQRGDVRLAAGKLDATQLAQVAERLAVCPRCARVLPASMDSAYPRPLPTRQGSAWRGRRQ